MSLMKKLFCVESGLDTRSFLKNEGNDNDLIPTFPKIVIFKQYFYLTDYSTPLNSLSLRIKQMVHIVTIHLTAPLILNMNH